MQVTPTRIWEIRDLLFLLKESVVPYSSAAFSIVPLSISSRSDMSLMQR